MARLEPGLPLRAAIAAARRMPAFAARWDDASDPCFRPFAAASICLYRPQDSQVPAFCDALTTANRARFLTQLSGLPVTPGFVRQLVKTRWKSFSRKDWCSLFAAAADPKLRRMLGHLHRVNRSLIQQLKHLPTEFWLPRLLEILNDVRISPDRWCQVVNAIDSASPIERADFRVTARRIDRRGALWDAIMLAIEGRTRPLPVPAAAFGSAILAPLRTADDLAGEGVRMRNCLAQLVGQVTIGSQLLFRGIGDTPVTAGLDWTPAGWQPGDSKGLGNQVLDPDIGFAVRQELQVLADRLNAGGSSSAHEQIDRFVDVCAGRAETEFAAAQIDMLSAALLEIRGKSIGPGNGAYVIFSLPNGGYIQFMDVGPGTGLLVEIGSHKFNPDIDRFLTEPAVTLIEQAGFLWPRGQANFQRRFPFADNQSHRTVAAFALHCLARVYRYRPGLPADAQVHIPDETR